MPYNPQVSPQPIRADMSGWGRALMEIMGEKDRKAEQAKQEAKKFKTYLAMGEQLGMNKDELLTKDAATLEGMVSGRMTKMTLDQEAEKLKQLMAERTAQEDFAKALQQAGGRNALRTLNQGNGPVQPPPLTGDMVMQAMAENPGSVNARNAPDVLRIMQAGAEGQPFFNAGDVGQLKPIAGAPGYGVAVTGPRQSQVIYTGGPQGQTVTVPGVGDIGVVTTKPGQSTIVPGQQTQGQIREALAKAEADMAKLRKKMENDPDLAQYLGGALAEQESLANSYRQALGMQSAPAAAGPQKAPAAGAVIGGYKFKGGNPNDKANWEKVK